MNTMLFTANPKQDGAFSKAWRLVPNTDIPRGLPSKYAQNSTRSLRPILCEI